MLCEPMLTPPPSFLDRFSIMPGVKKWCSKFSVNSTAMLQELFRDIRSVAFYLPLWNLLWNQTLVSKFGAQEMAVDTWISKLSHFAHHTARALPSKFAEMGVSGNGVHPKDCYERGKPMATQTRFEVSVLRFMLDQCAMACYLNWATIG